MKTKFFDAHNDCAVEIENDQNLKEYYCKNLKINDTKIISAIWTTEFKNNAFDKLKSIYDKIVQVAGNNSLFSIEDCGFVNNKNIQNVLNLKPTYMSLTWNFQNQFAGGASECGKLSSSGKQLIKQLECNNIIVDTAHLNEESFWDVARISSKPLFCSHTAFKDIAKANRNLNHAQVKEIVKSGGLVGLYFVSHFLNESGTAGVNDVVKHIMYFLENFNEKNLCFGTDFYGTKNLPIGISNYSDIVKVIEALKKNGVSDNAINNICFNNLNEFINSNKKINV